MYGENVLDGTNFYRLQTEASAWLSVMDKLACVVVDLNSDQRKEAKRLIGETKTALRCCLSTRIGFASRKVKTAQQLVKSVLRVFSEWSELVDCVFFLGISTSSLDAIVTGIEALDPKRLSKAERRRLTQSLESSVHALDAKLEALQRDLDRTGPEKTGELQGG